MQNIVVRTETYQKLKVVAASLGLKQTEVVEQAVTEYAKNKGVLVEVKTVKERK